jgi:hypothetical protein
MIFSNDGGFRIADFTPNLEDSGPEEPDPDEERAWEERCDRAEADVQLAAASPDMLAALLQAQECLRVLCFHDAFAGDAPEFNRRGIGYQTARVIREALKKTGTQP